LYAKEDITMADIKEISIDFQQNMSKLGFAEDNALFLVDTQVDKLPDVEILFHLYRARDFGATAVYLRKQLNGSYKSQVYLFDRTGYSFSDKGENELSEIQKKIWTSGEVPLACIFYNTDVTILDCTKSITKDYKPEYLVKSLNTIGKAHDVYNDQFAVKIKSGVFWEQDELKNKFKFSNSAYDRLIRNIKTVEQWLSKTLKHISKEIITKIIVQSILIKYLEERIDTNGQNLLSEKYFRKYDAADTFGDVLRKGKFVELLDDLNDDKTGFNGNVFKWESEEKEQLENLDLSVVADLLDTKKSDLASLQGEIEFPDWRYFEFQFIPVELISRLYEEFLGKDKQNNGLYYTPAHLAKLLVDECLPLKKYKEISLSDFNILDPACGSGIFLVIAFKRLVQIWRLQNEMKRPKIKNLKSILKNIYGVDKEEQAVRLASFSLCLALCDELEPKKIISELQFDDLRKENLIRSDFFTCEKIKDRKFDLVIGNPPFVRGSISNYSNTWKIENKKVKIPQGQIALKFLSESFSYLKDKGLVCLIIKSSGLLYNSTSVEYKQALFSKYNVAQIFDFTALARNKSLWDNGADVASAAVFAKNEKPDYSKNILHLTFRRTKATKDRIVFEIDDYDLHFVNRQTAIDNEFIWKINLLGGGRIRTLVEKTDNTPSLKQVLQNNNCIIEEGFEIGSKRNLSPDYIYQMPVLPTEAITEEKINYKLLAPIDNNLKFSKVPQENAFKAPNLIIWENIGEKRFPVFYNEISFSFKRRLISIKSMNNDIEFLKSIYDSFTNYYSFYKCYFLATSSETLINRNNTFLLRDLKNIPFIISDAKLFSEYDLKIITDIDYLVDFFIHGEKSKSLNPISRNQFQPILENYGAEFSKALNTIYENDKRKFRLSNVIRLKNSLIATVFRYDSLNENVKFQNDFSELNIDGLTNHEISSQLSANRIIKLYPQKDTIVFVKPNQYRYWLSLIAYRDADKCFADLVHAGY
jgi:methylase of polypeptide subunit release factors